MAARSLDVLGEPALKQVKFLLLAHCTAGEVGEARDIVQTAHHEEIGVHSSEALQQAGGF
jgi:hypothetical protein